MIWFIHITKTAGTAIRHSLKKHLDPRNKVPEGYHRTAQDVVSELGISAWRMIQSFAVIRDPHDRLVSAWLEMNKDPKTAAKLRETYKNFDGWIRWACEDPSRGSPIHPTAISHHRTQVSYIEGAAGNIIVSRLLVFEAITEGFIGLCADWGIIPDPLEVVYPTRGHVDYHAIKPYRDFYTQQTAALVELAYAADFKLHDQLLEGRHGRHNQRPVRAH